MIWLPQLAGGEAGAGDERAGDAETHEKFAPVDSGDCVVQIGCAHIFS